MINQIRLQQQQQQLNAIRQRQRSATTIAEYKSRDPLTGDRLLQSPDGSIIRAAWLANSNPQAIPPLIMPSRTIGQSGYASQIPSR